MYIAPLSDHLNLIESGAKAYNLSVLIRNGFPVPSGFVIKTQAYYNYMQNPEEVLSELKLALQQLLTPLNSEGYMVRSSAVGEDTAASSFAGQLDSFKTTANIEDILHNVLLCWQSANKAHVQIYQHASGVQLKGMAVVVQHLINPDFAGVLFSASPNKPGFMLGEYVKGHGEKLVSGAVNPERFYINRKSGKCLQALPFSVQQMYELALKTEVYFKGSQDIEWVIKNGELNLVQSRPITTLPSRRKIYWSNTNVNENYPEPLSPLLYSVARDAYYHYFKNLAKLFQVKNQKISELEPQLSNIIGAFGGKMYYNMSSIHDVISASPFANLLKGSFNNFVGYQGNENEEKESNSLIAKLRFVKDFVKLNNRLEKNVSEFENRVNQYSKNCIQAMEVEEINACFFDFIEIRMHNWYKASLADFFAMAYHGMLGKFCMRFYPQNQQGIHNQLIQAIPGLISSKPIIDTWHIAELIRNNPTALKACRTMNAQDFYSFIKHDSACKSINTSIQNYLNNWGFRCSGELMLSIPNYIEQPENFISLLQKYTQQSNSNPIELIAQKHQESIEVLKQFKKHIYKTRQVFLPLSIAEVFILKLLVKLCTKGIAARERARLKQALLYYRFKTILIKIGQNFQSSGLIKEESAIFYFTYKEISEHLNASALNANQTKAIIEHRKIAFTEGSKEIYPDDFSTDFGKYTKPNNVIKTTNQLEDNEPSACAAKGLSACGGYLKGRLKVLEGVMDAYKLEEGDILVTRQTDPGWAAVFPLISGLIVERGGMLSHGAIVAREFGIPAIVGVENALRIFKDGDLVILDANKGRIYFDD